MCWYWRLAEIGFEVDADECSPTGRSNPSAVESIACDISESSGRAGRESVGLSGTCHHAVGVAQSTLTAPDLPSMLMT